VVALCIVLSYGVEPLDEPACKAAHGELPSHVVRNNYVKRLGIYLVLPEEIGGNVSLDRTTPDIGKAASRYAASNTAA
jgi:hypothetical protein